MPCRESRRSDEATLGADAAVKGADSQREHAMDAGTYRLMRLSCAVIILMISGLIRIAAAQDSTCPATQPAELTAEKPSVKSIIPALPNYGGDFWHREFLTGDWGGARTDLAKNGILFDLGVTQVLQGNAHGGKDTRNAIRYSGSADYTIKLDTARMDLWPGGLFVIRGETQFGQSINSKVGSILAPNYDALIPVPDESGITTLSEFYFAQALSEKLIVAVGKLDLTTGDANIFAHDEKTQFLNAAFRINPVLFTAAPYTTMAVSVTALPTKWLTINSFVCDNDPDGAATSTGFNTAFHGRNWLSVGQEYDITWKPFGLEGHQRAGWFYTTKDLTLLDQDVRIRLPLTLTMRLLRPRLRLVPGPLRAATRALKITRDIGRDLGDVERVAGDWGFYYNFDQYLYTKPGDPTQGFGPFGRFGLSSGEANPFHTFYSLGLGGKGLIDSRPRDTYGVGYYYSNFSDELPPILHVNAEQGVEVFYNIEITPWLHITPDFQVIVNPAGGFQNRDVALVYGLRLQMTF
jgi:porin